MAVVSLVLAAMAGLGLGALRAVAPPTPAAQAGSTPSGASAAPRPERSSPEKSTPVAGPGGIDLQGDRSRAAAGERINLSGNAGSPGVSLVVQERNNGNWVDFPAHGTTRSDGSFSSYVLFGRAGEHVLRMSAPDSGRVSNPVTVTVV